MVDAQSARHAACLWATGQFHRSDPIACGTSVGGLPIRPQREVSVVIDGIGAQTNRFAAATV